MVLSLLPQPSSLAGVSRNSSSPPLALSLAKEDHGQEEQRTSKGGAISRTSDSLKVCFQFCARCTLPPSKSVVTTLHLHPRTHRAPFHSSANYSNHVLAIRTVEPPSHILLVCVVGCSPLLSVKGCSQTVQHEWQWCNSNHQSHTPPSLCCNRGGAP